MSNPPIPMNGTLGDPFQNESKSLDEVLRLAMEGVLYNLHVALPCKIVKVRSNSYVDVQPLLQRRYTTGALVNIPVIQNVPVVHPRGADFWIKLPIAVGGLGTILFAERSIDSWKVKGLLTDPQDSRRHDLSDAIFFPGLYPMSDLVIGAADDMILKNAEAQIYLQKDGKFLIKNESEELLDQISSLAQAVSDLASAVNTLASAVASGFTSLGLIPQAAQATAAGIAASIAGTSAGTIKGNVEDLTGSA